MVNKKKYIVHGGRRLSFDFPIEQIVEISDRVIVVFDYEAYDLEDPMMLRNAICLNRFGKELWRIQKSTLVIEHSETKEPLPNPFVGVANNDGKLLAYDINGSRFDLDPETGKLSNPVLTK